MRYSINCDVTKEAPRDTDGMLRNGLYADQYEPCAFYDRLLVLPERGMRMSRKGEWEVERTVREIYDRYSKFFSLKSETNIAVGAAWYYTETLYRYMEAVSGELGEYCKATGQEELCNMLSKIVSESYNFLLRGLQEEIRKNTARYALRPVSHYIRLANLRLAHLKERRKKDKKTRHLLRHNNEISESAVCEALLIDCREKSERFTRNAQIRYEAYVEVLRVWFEKHQISLPEYVDGEEWKTFCHALQRKRRAFELNGEEGVENSEKKYASYTPCNCEIDTCKTWGTGDEADYEIAKWYGMWYGEEGESFEFTEETIGGWKYNVKRCYMDVLPQGECTHIEFCYEDVPNELWTMHIGKNLLELTGPGSEWYYVVLENMEHQIMRVFCETEMILGSSE